MGSSIFTLRFRAFCYKCSTSSNPLVKPTMISVNKGNSQSDGRIAREFDKGYVGPSFARASSVLGSQRQSVTIMASWMVGRSLAANYRCVRTIMEIRLKPSICDALWWLFGILIGKSQLTRQYDRLDSRRRPNRRHLFTPELSLRTVEL